MNHTSGLVRYEFNPQFHAAILQQPSNDVPANHVIMVTQAGYLCILSILITIYINFKLFRPQPPAISVLTRAT